MEYYVNIFACVYCIVLEWIVRAEIRTETAGNGLQCVLNGFCVFLSQRRHACGRVFPVAREGRRAAESGRWGGRLCGVRWRNREGGRFVWGMPNRRLVGAVRGGGIGRLVGLAGVVAGLGSWSGWSERVAGTRGWAAGGWNGWLEREDGRRDGSPGSPAVLPRGQPALDNPHLSTHTCHSALVNPHLSTHTCQPAHVNPHLSFRTCYCTPVIARCQSTSILRAFVPFPMPLPGR